MFQSLQLKDLERRMNLREARCTFSRLLIKLGLWLEEQGQEYAFDEGTNHQQRGHMEGSLHYSGCAQDILFYGKAGNYLIRTEDYKTAGLYWESLNLFCRWGGRFDDGNHFSFSPPELFGKKA